MLGKTKLAAGLASAITMLAAGPAAAHILPVGTWHLNEGRGTVAHDEFPNNDDGTLTGGANWTQGRFWTGLSFSGSGSAVDIPDASSLEPANVTVSAWVNAGTSPGNFKYIVAKGANSCQAGSYGLYTGENGGLEFYVATNAGLTYTISANPGPGIWDGKWHSVIGTYDGSNVDLYVDGQLVGSGAPDTAPISYGLRTSNDLEIGNYPGCPSQDLGFVGSIDEVRIFDRALGAQEIRAAVAVSRALPPLLPTDTVL